MDADIIDDGPDAAETMAKQRRFLTIVSVIIIALYALKVDIKCEAEYSGFGIVLHRPENAVWGLWIVWVWSVWRYLQRLNAFWQVLRGEVLEDVDAEDLRRAHKVARLYLIRLCKDGSPQVAIDPTHLDPHIVGPVSLSPTSKSHPNMPASSPIQYYRQTSDGGRRYETEGAYAYRTKLGAEGTIGFNPSMIWTQSESRLHRFRSWLSALVRLPRLTDQATPLLAALVALGSPLMWPHSLSQKQDCPRETPVAMSPTGHQTHRSLD